MLGRDVLAQERVKRISFYLGAVVSMANCSDAKVRTLRLLNDGSVSWIFDMMQRDSTLAPCQESMPQKRAYACKQTKQLRSIL